MAKPRPGMGRGLSAILSVSGGGAKAGGTAAGAADRADQSQPEAAQAPVRPGGARGAGRLAGRAGRAAAGARAAQGRWHLRARRRRAALASGTDRGPETIPALVREREDAASLEVALIENMAREDLNPIEEARACAALVEELGLTREQVGRRVGRSRVAVSNLMRLLDLPDEVDRAAAEGGAERRTRQGAAAGRGPRRAPEPRARGRRGGLVGQAHRSAGKGANAGGRAPSGAAMRGAPEWRGSRIPTRSRRRSRSRMPWRTRSAPMFASRPCGTADTAPSSRSRRSSRRSSWRAGCGRARWHRAWASR